MTKERKDRANETGKSVETVKIELLGGPIREISRSGFTALEIIATTVMLRNQQKLLKADGYLSWNEKSYEPTSKADAFGFSHEYTREHDVMCFQFYKIKSGKEKMKGGTE